MVISSIYAGVVKNSYQAKVSQPKNKACQNETSPKECLKNFGLYSNYIASINKVKISFKGYGEDDNPAQKLFWILTGRNDIYEDNYTKERYVNGGNSLKKWINAPARELLNRGADEAIQSICTITKKNDCYPGIPNNIPTPNGKKPEEGEWGYDHWGGDNWGTRANYIEINPRTIAKHEGSRVSEGLLNAIKLLPAIPPSGDKFANCIILSQLYPTLGSDGWTNGNDGIYAVNLHEGISKNLTSEGLGRDGQRMTDREMVKAFNDLAHLRGFKTGFRMPLSSKQLRVHGQEFNWGEHENAYIDACKDAINLGFDAIYFDSAKHVGWYDMDNYHGNGDVPSYGAMSYITSQIRQRTGKNNLSFIGEHCYTDERYVNMGLTAGSNYGNPEDISEIKRNSNSQKNNFRYKAGPNVSDDNDENCYNFDKKLKRLEGCLYGYEYAEDKLPTFMQMNDLFPLTPYTSTHSEMERSISKSYDGSPKSHIENIFDTSRTSEWYQNEVNQKFLGAIYR